jgi:hypothetical protein
MIRAKKPWAAAAAAALLFGVVGTAFGYAWQYRAYTAPPVEEAKKKGEDVHKEYTTWNGKYSAAEKQVQDDENDVRKIIMGTDERLNWLMLNEFINQCMPAPALRADGKLKEITPETITVTTADGKDLKVPGGDYSAFIAKDKNDRWQIVNATPKPGDAVTVIYQTDPGAKDYFKFPEVKEAALNYFNRQEITKAGQAKPVEEDLSRLIQINLESVYALYSPDVKAVYSKLASERFPFLGMDPKKVEEMQKGNGLPEGAGWVIELRGYSYFGDSPRFVIKTLLNEIERRGAAPDQASGGNPAQSGQPMTPPADSKPATEAVEKKQAPADADSSDKDQKEQVVAKDPVKEKEEFWNKGIRGRVSHPFLFDYDVDKEAEPGKFKILGGSVVDSLVGQAGTATTAAAPGAAPGAASGGGPGAPGGNTGATGNMGMERMARMAGERRGMGMGGTGMGGMGMGGGGSGGSGGFTQIVPVGGTGGGSSAGGGGPRMGPMGGEGPGGMGGMMAGVRARMEGYMKNRMGGTGGMGGMGPGFGLQPAKVPQKKATGDRTEFKLIFVWREWTPSDALVKPEAAAEPPK